MPQAAAQAPIENASAESVRALLDATRPGGLTLLDVRMEPEYEEFHLPGATLVPLPDLPDRLGEIDKEKPVVVYCRGGMRSAAAARLLAGAGFPHIVNMLGGAMAWQGAAATGTPDAGLTLLSGNETPRQILRAALGMEAALGAFYKKLAAAAQDGDTAATFTRLALFEERHLHHVHSLYDKETGETSDLDTLLATAAPDLEGGLPAADFLALLGGEPTSARETLELAASVEAQALDLYSRLAGRTNNAQSKELFTTLALEEKAHLRAVASLLTRLPNA
ncbi:rhodanese-like domain-containing protein [Desulfovibrio sp. TomC]|uniref:rhodanese-like domain-containing protein n=1 Tax=Desulfovibrio sp. TomC TaxID=1562888 RepID=UPI0005756437|nr:rhodanese-like domain-containing protein [Desulfovibrio sp. TomC]KHK04559.1 Rhodanese-like domain protein [Desulfovibrio sp. TomC]